MRPSLAAAVLAVLAVVPSAARPAADPAQHAHGTPAERPAVEDHSQHAHPAPERLGTVHFPTSCAPEAQPSLVRGVALLHSFGYAEATAAFAEAAAADPECAMAAWGEAMSWLHLIWAPPTAAELAAGRAAAERAVSLAAAEGTPPRERAWVEAIAAYYRDADTLDHRTRVRAFEAAMGRVAAAHPEDDEAAIFHALALLGVAYNSPVDKTYALQRRAAEVLNRLLPEHPEHPGIAHYMIHSFDYPEIAELALPAARAYAAIAPDSPHALHMPSHIFVRLGLWDEAIASNLDSARVDDRQTTRERPGATGFNTLHAIDYLAYGYLQTARDAEARALVERVAAVGALDDAQFAAAYALAAVPGRYALERRDWAAAAALADPPAVVPWERFPYALALVDFARAIGAARAGDVDRARQAVARLETVAQQLASGAKTGFDWASQVEVQRLAAAGWLAHAEGHPDEARRLLRAAADLEDSIDKHPVTPGSLLPAREMLADLALELGDAAAALAAYEASLRSAPRRFHSLAGAAHAAERLGDTERAAALYAELAELAAKADTERPELARAREVRAH